MNCLNTPRTQRIAAQLLGGGVFVFLPLWVFFFLFFQNCYRILYVCLSTYRREIRKCFRRLVELCNEVSTCSSKHHQVQQRVRSKSVGSMNWCTCRLSGCPQSWHYFIFTILDWQSLQDGQNNSHTLNMVMSFIGMSFLKRGGEGQVELFLGPILEHVKCLKSVVEVFWICL